MAVLISILVIICCALALMALEAFVPGVSIAGGTGVILFGIAAYLCWNAYGPAVAIILLIACTALSYLVIRLVIRSMKQGKLSKTGVFLNEQVIPAVNASSREEIIMIGMNGTASSALRPAGIAEFDSLRVHVVSESGFIEKEEKVIIVRIEGSKISVRRLDK